MSKSYRMGATIVHAVSNMSIRLDRGEHVAVCGRSGSGKSTLLCLLGLLQRPDTGTYLLEGSDTSLLSETARAEARCRLIGFVFQAPALLPRASALENVELPLVYAGVRRSERRRKAKVALQRVGLDARMLHLPRELSGGEQQRVSIARAIVNDPALILADEPTGALDSATAAGVLSLFDDFHRSGCAVCVVTHAPEVAERAKRRITLQDGDIVSDQRIH